MIYWIVSLASLAGVWLNIRRHVASYWLWTGTNAAWAWADFQHGLPQQAALHLVYFALAIYGIVRWGRDAKNAEATP